MQIVSGQLLFTLHHSIDLETRREQGRFVVACPQLGIDVYGADEAAAREMFAEALADSWTYLTREGRDLTGDAVELRRRLRNLATCRPCRAARRRTP